MDDAKMKVEHILDQDRIPTWPPMKKAIWDAVTSEKLNDGHYINAYALTDKLYAAALSASPQPAASDVPHDVVELVARAICSARKLNPDCLHQHDDGDDRPTDDSKEYRDPFTHEPRTMLFHYGWRNHVAPARAAIAALATPAPSTSTETPDLDAWAYAFANYRQGQRSTPSCEEPGAADIRICRDLIKGMLACRPSAPSTSTEEALRAENAKWGRADLAKGLAALDGISLRDVLTSSGDAANMTNWREYLGRADDLLAHLSLAASINSDPALSR